MKEKTGRNTHRDLPAGVTAAVLPLLDCKNTVQDLYDITAKQHQFVKVQPAAWSLPRARQGLASCCLLLPASCLLLAPCCRAEATSSPRPPNPHNLLLPHRTWAGKVSKRRSRSSTKGSPHTPLRARSSCRVSRSICLARPSNATSRRSLSGRMDCAAKEVAANERAGCWNDQQ